ncbi:MAG: CBS domain-containing protein [Candidatus Methanoperedens sp.]|nr:CBS domain-containing protein [Candidatus Methanoperedens sp.]
MKIKDVMNKDVIICAPNDTLGHLADMFKKNHISGIPVVDKGKVVGLVSETDLIKLFKIPEYSNDLWLPSPFEIIEIPIRDLVKFEETKKFFENMKLRPVKEIMTKTVHAISPDEDLEDASTMMVKYDVNRLPVIENGKLVGIVARSDIIKGLSESAE